MAKQAPEQNQAQAEHERQLQEQMLRGRMHDIGLKLLVLSGKGGVGKSTVAANLAASLARERKNVGLLDVDVHGPSIPKLMGLEGRQPHLESGEIIPIQISDRLKVMSIGFLLPGGEVPVIWRGPRKYHLIRQFLTDVAWGHLDYLVIDSPPGTGDEPLAVAQLVGQPSGAVIVTTPQDLAISDVRRCISFCRELSLPVVGIVENMSGLVCPACGARIDLFKTGGGKALAAEMKVPFLGQIPIDPTVVTMGDAGTPFMQTRSAVSEAFAKVVKKILDAGSQPAGKVKVQTERKENGHMKIAVPVAAGRLSMHFGHCEEFVILEVDQKSKQIVGQSNHQSPPHEPGALPRWLHELGAEVIIAGGMGMRAQQLFAQNGISVVVGAPADTPENLVAAYLDETLETGSNICDH
jgi:ATP-binding protein involved in chromosome partitioning